MSAVSPNVQTMTMPVPLSGSASRCASTGTSAPNTGVRTVVPASGAYRPSAGCTTSATQAGSSSGRVVATITGPPSWPANAIRYQAPRTCLSSRSAWATAVRNVTSHSAGPSARYAWPRARLRRNARCEMARASSPTVRYFVDQSTDRPIRRQMDSNARSSSSVSRWHSSTKLRRDTGTGRPPGFSGGLNPGS